MSRLTHDEVDHFAQELSSFARSGLPIPEALAALATQLPPGKLQQLSKETAEATQRGAPLSEALQKSNVRIPDEFIALVQCGEITGDMTSILDFATTHSRRVTRYRSALLTSLVYPFILILAMLASSVLLANFLVPHFEEIFRQLGAELPALTQTVMEASHLLRGTLGLVVIPLLVLLIVLPLVLPQWRERLLTTLGLFPGFGPLAATGDASTFSRFLAEMLPRGVPLPIALKAAGLAVTMRETRHSLSTMSLAAEQGRPTHQHLAAHIPATAAFLFRQGEQNGRLAESCAVISTYCDDRFERISKKTIAFMEPLLVFMIAVFFGFLVIAMYLPLFSIPKVLGR